MGKGDAGRERVTQWMLAGKRGRLCLTVSPSQPRRPLLSHPCWPPLPLECGGRALILFHMGGRRAEGLN